MPISSEDLSRRLAEADRQLTILRRATRELRALGEQILKDRPKLETDAVDRPKRSHRGSVGRD